MVFTEGEVVCYYGGKHNILFQLHYDAGQNLIAEYGSAIEIGDLTPWDTILDATEFPKSKCVPAGGALREKYEKLKTI